MLQSQQSSDSRIPFTYPTTTALGRSSMWLLGVFGVGFLAKASNLFGDFPNLWIYAIGISGVVLMMISFFRGERSLVLAVIGSFVTMFIMTWMLLEMIL